MKNLNLKINKVKKFKMLNIKCRYQLQILILNQNPMYNHIDPKIQLIVKNGKKEKLIIMTINLEMISQNKEVIGSLLYKD